MAFKHFLNTNNIITNSCGPCWDDPWACYPVFWPPTSKFNLTSALTSYVLWVFICYSVRNFYRLDSLEHLSGLVKFMVLYMCVSSAQKKKKKRKMTWDDIKTHNNKKIDKKKKTFCKSRKKSIFCFPFGLFCLYLQNHSGKWGEKEWDRDTLSQTAT